jgi:hypothetical protein
MKFETLPHKIIWVNGYKLKVIESDPYYHVIVTKGEWRNDHLLMNDDVELEALADRYRNE